MIRNLFVSLALALALGGGFSRPACAQHGTPADTQDFAKSLAEHGYFDLAEELVQAEIVKASGTDKADFELCLAEIQAEQGKREKDLAVRIAKLKEAAEKFEKYIQNYPSSPRTPEMRYQIADLYRVAGEQAVAAVKNENDQGKKEKLREDGIKIFAKSIVLTEKRIADLKLLTKKSEREDNELIALSFALGKLYYSQAMIYENRAGTNAQLSLQNAKETLGEFEIDNPGSLLVYEARRILGQIAMEENKPDEAYDFFDNNCNQILNYLDEDTKNAADVGNDESSREVVAASFLEKTRFLLSVRNDAEGAIKCADDITKRVPALIQAREGKQLLALLAEAYINEGKSDKGREIAQRVADADPTGTAGIRARELLDKAGGAGGAGGLMKALEAAVIQKDIARAEKIAARVLSGHGQNGSAGIDPNEALFLLGQLYYDTGRPIDAAVCFSAVAEKQDFAKASAAKLNEALAYAQAFKIDNAALWRTKNKAAREELRARFPNSSEALDAAYVDGLTAENENRLDEAVELFLKVPVISIKYGDAQARAGKNLLLLAQEAATRSQTDEAKKRFDKAEQALSTARTSLLDQVPKEIGEKQIKWLKDAAFNAQLQLAGLYLQPLVRKPQKCVDLLAEAEKEAKDDKGKTRLIWDLRIKAFVQMNRGKEAGELLEKFLQEAKASGGAGAGSEAALSVAAALDAEAFEKDKANKADPEVLALWKESAKWYRRTVEESRKGGGSRKSFEKVAMRLMDIASRLMGLPENPSIMSFGPNMQLTEKESLDRAWEAFQMVAHDTTSGDVNIERQRSLARCAAMLGKWTDAVQALEAVATARPLFKDHKLDREAQKQYQNLPDVYQDLAAVSLRAGQMTREAFYFDHAIEILSDLMVSAERGGKLYWECRYLSLLGLYWSGKYEALKASLDSLSRAAPDADNDKFGIKTKIQALKKECEKIISK